MVLCGHSKSINSGCPLYMLTSKSLYLLLLLAALASLSKLPELGAMQLYSVNNGVAAYC